MEPAWTRLPQDVDAGRPKFQNFLFPSLVSEVWSPTTKAVDKNSNLRHIDDMIPSFISIIVFFVVFPLHLIINWAIPNEENFEIQIDLILVLLRRMNDIKSTESSYHKASTYYGGWMILSQPKAVITKRMMIWINSLGTEQWKSNFSRANFSNTDQKMRWKIPYRWR